MSKFKNQSFPLSSQTLLSDANRAGWGSRPSKSDQRSGHERLRPRAVRTSRRHAGPEEVPLQHDDRRPQRDQRHRRRIRKERLRQPILGLLVAI